MASRRGYYGNIRAPEFPDDVEWLNTGRPMSLAALRGKLVLLDFWTYGCINCMHVIPDLKRLEALYPDELVVIGVHSAKFANEGDSEQIRQIVLRYELEHPVVNDRDFRIWNAYAVRAWPTTVLIDPRGYVLAAHSGERILETYQDIIATAVREYDATGLLDRKPLSLTLERTGVPETALSFPGKVLADEAGGRLLIADSNHHRIVITDLEGWVQEVIGSGDRGLRDGLFGEAQFAKPQGLALDGQRLYVADTENHAIRVADLQQRTVRTVAGDGTLGDGQADALPLAEARLNSPWDLALAGHRLYIAMAGLHQLWVLDLEQRRIGPYAGSGREGLLDGPLARAALAQPSGVTRDRQLLYFADSEASAIRSASLDPQGEVKTIIGEGLFEFGDVDGEPPTARLQHPLGVAYHREALYVADTYNHKVKIVDPARGSVASFLGTGEHGWRDGLSPRFYEPGGLSAANDRLYIADTNNHLLRVADLSTRRVSTLRLQDPQNRLAPLQRESGAAVWRLPEQRVQPGPGLVRAQLRFAPGYKLNDMAPSTLTWREPEGDVVRITGTVRQTTWHAEGDPATLPATFNPGNTVLRGDLALYYCATVKASVCLIRVAQVEVPMVVDQAAETHEVRAELQVAGET